MTLGAPPHSLLYKIAIYRCGSPFIYQTFKSIHCCIKHIKAIVFGTIVFAHSTPWSNLVQLQLLRAIFQQFAECYQWVKEAVHAIYSIAAWATNSVPNSLRTLIYHDQHIAVRWWNIIHLFQNLLIQFLTFVMEICLTFVSIVHGKFGKHF